MAGLDEIDLAILHMLQEDARGLSPADMAARLPVSDQTVRNRIGNMEAAGVIEGYVPLVNYDAAELPLHIKFTCTVPIDDRSSIAREVRAADHVIRVEEMLSATENLHVSAVMTAPDQINTVIETLHGLGASIDTERLVHAEHHQPLNHFGDTNVAEE